MPECAGMNMTKMAAWDKRNHLNMKQHRHTIEQALRSLQVSAGSRPGLLDLSSKTWNEEDTDATPKRSKDKWLLEYEDSCADQFELSSPIAMTEEETQISINLSKALVGKLHGGPCSALHIHIDSHCLSEERRLLRLLLIMEQFHDQLAETVRSADCQKSWSASMPRNNPRLLRDLRRSWHRNSSKEGFLVKLFHKHSNSFEVEELDEYQGYRNLAVNVCHLLDVPCCMDCGKNNVAKFGYLEFRLFNSEFGSNMELAISLAQRLTKAACTLPLNDLDSLIAPDKDEVPHISSLFDFLNLDISEFSRAFQGPKRWTNSCFQDGH